MRNRGWRRAKDIAKAKRKRRIDRYYAGIFYHPWYNNLHQYSKNKIHCSCPMCRNKSRNRGAAAMYSGSFNPTMQDRRKLDSMIYDEEEYFNE